METVGVRVLKAQLSRYIGKAKAGETIIVTEHGQEVAELIPISKERRAVQHLATEHRLKWNGKKPVGCTGGTVEGKTIAETILDERR